MPPENMLHIPQLLKPDELELIDSLLNDSAFLDGSKTASMAAKAVKNNLQIDRQDQDTLPRIQAIFDEALRASPLFQIYSMPAQIVPFLLSKYEIGMAYGWHVDSPFMGQPPIRTDLAMTVFLSGPDAYEGGELVIQGPQGVTAFKAGKGDAVVYPCQYLHCVNPVLSGQRSVAVSWIQSQVKDIGHRQILFDLNQVHGSLYQRDPNAPEANLLLQAHSNLLRMWAGS